MLKILRLILVAGLFFNLGYFWPSKPIDIKFPTQRIFAYCWNPDPDNLGWEPCIDRAGALNTQGGLAQYMQFNVDCISVYPK